MAIFSDAQARFILLISYLIESLNRGKSYNLELADHG